MPTTLPRMTWDPVQPRPCALPTPAAATLSVSAAAWRGRRRMTLTLRLEHLDRAPAWCRPGGRVSAEAGTGEHAGMLRLTPGGPFRFRGGDNWVRNAVLSLPAPENAPPAGCKQAPVPARVLENAIEITLPAWTTPKACADAGAGTTATFNAPEAHAA